MRCSRVTKLEQVHGQVAPTDDNRELGTEERSWCSQILEGSSDGQTGGGSQNWTNAQHGGDLIGLPTLISALS